MDIDKLKTELADPKYSAMSDAEAAASLNDETIVTQGPVPAAKLIRASASHDILYELRQGSSTGPKPKRQLCDAALNMIINPHVPALDLTDPAVDAMLDGLVAVGVITADIATEIREYGQTTVSRAAEIGLGHVKTGHVEEARR